MNITLTILLFLSITGIIWLVNKILPFKICPVCAGVSGTWLFLTVGILVGFISLRDFQLLITLLMGGTVVGIAYQGEKVFHWVSANSLLWKLVVISFGFPLAYLAFIKMSWITFIVEVIFLGLLGYLLFIQPSLKIRQKMRITKEPSAIKELEEKLKKCC